MVNPVAARGPGSPVKADAWKPASGWSAASTTTPPPHTLLWERRLVRLPRLLPTPFRDRRDPTHWCTAIKPVAAPRRGWRLLMTAVPCCCCADRDPANPAFSGRRGAEVVFTVGAAFG